MNFLDQIEKFDDKIALLNEVKTISYKDLLEKSERITKSLNKRKLIFLIGHNDIEFISTYVGCLKKKIVPLLLSSQIHYFLLENLIAEYKPHYILLPKNYQIILSSFEKVLSLEKFFLYKIKKDEKYLLNSDLALLLSTSGSTGNKKFVRVSYENLENNTKNICKYLEIKKNHRTVTTMQPNYTYGLSIINTHLYSGASILVTEAKIIEKHFWELMKKFKINSFGGVPYFYEILKKINFSNIKLPDLKYITQAGGALDEDLTKYLIEYSEKNKTKFIIMYGQAEATSRMTYLPFKNLKSKIGSVGIPIPGGKILFNNNKSKKNKKNEIIYSGKNVCMGYAKNYKDLKKKDENLGKLYTGDLGRIDQDGYLYITGRKSRSIKVFGHRLNLDDIENLLKNKGYNCLCKGSKNEVIIYFTDKRYDKKLLKYISEITNINLNYFKMKHIKEIPKNESGKILYAELD